MPVSKDPASPQPAYSREGDTITLRISADDFDGLLFTLGYAISAAHEKGGAELPDAMLRLANRINEGNPNWKPYTFPGDGMAMDTESMP